MINNDSMVMPVAPMSGTAGYGNGGFGGLGGDWAWILLLLLIGGNGWGFGGWGGMMGAGMMGMDFGLYPWLNNSQHISDGFRDQMLNTSISSISDKITSGFGNVSTQLCNGFAGVNAGIANGFAQAEIANNSRQMANMNSLFGIQSALQTGFCDNRAGLADLKYTVATENCADRAALSEGIRDILAAQTAGIQSIKDQLCQDKIDAKNDEIAQLRQEVLFARGQASRVTQNGTIIDGIYNRLATCPVDTTPVFGRQPIFTCPTNVGNNCGCGCGNGFAN
jgi:hypothetical protein